jgi:hypothetical protein
MVLVYSSFSCKTLLCGVGCFRCKIDIRNKNVCNIMQGTVKQQRQSNINNTTNADYGQRP